MIHSTAIISDTAKIADDVQIGPYTVIGDQVEIDNGTRIDSHVVINGPTRIGKDNHIYQFASIGDDPQGIMAYCHIAHDCILGSQIIMANNATLAGHVQIDDWVICGGFSGAHQFCKIGAHAFLGMYTGISRDVPAYTMASGQPAVPKGINSEGLKRRELYRKGLKLAEAIEQIEAIVDEQQELLPFLESLRSSERGIIR